MKIYCFDLDDTICFPNHEYKDTYKKYIQAKPNYQMIEKINKLYVDGNKILIFTARRMLTHDGDLEKIKEDVEEITISWLSKYSVNYNELIFGKPYADFYVDDKGINLKEFLDE